MFKEMIEQEDEQEGEQESKKKKKCSKLLVAFHCKLLKRVFTNLTLPLKVLQPFHLKKHTLVCFVGV